MSNPNSVQRLLAGAGLALCAIALPVLPAAAQEASTAATPTADAQTVTRDAETGKLRNATPEEQQKLQALKAAKAARFAAPHPQQKFHRSGAAGLRLNDQFLSSETAVRTPDGRIETICNDPHGGSEPAVPHVHTAAKPAPVEE